MIIVQAKLIPKDESAKNQIIEYSKDIIEKSRNEYGNISYNLFNNVFNEYLLFIEKWDSQEILKIHLKTEHFINFGKNIEGLINGDLIINVFDADEIQI